MLPTHNIAKRKLYSLFLNIVKRGKGVEHEIAQIAVFPIIFVTDCSVSIVKFEQVNVCYLLIVSYVFPTVFLWCSRQIFLTFWSVKYVSHFPNFSRTDLPNVLSSGYQVNNIRYMLLFTHCVKSTRIRHCVKSVQTRSFFWSVFLRI